MATVAQSQTDDSVAANLQRYFEPTPHIRSHSYRDQDGAGFKRSSIQSLDNSKQSLPSELQSPQQIAMKTSRSTYCSWLISLDDAIMTVGDGNHFHR